MMRHMCAMYMDVKANCHPLIKMHKKLAVTLKAQASASIEDTTPCLATVRMSLRPLQSCTALCPPPDDPDMPLVLTAYSWTSAAKQWLWLEVLLPFQCWPIV